LGFLEKVGSGKGENSDGEEEGGLPAEEEGGGVGVVGEDVTRDRRRQRRRRERENRIDVIVKNRRSPK